MKKTLSAVLSLTLTLSPLSVVNAHGAANANAITDQSSYALTVADSLQSDTLVTSDDSSCYSFDPETGELTLKGNIDRKELDNVDKYDVKSIKAEKGTILPEDCSSLFANFVQCTEIDFSDVDTSKTTDMKDMFSTCKSLTSIDLSGFDTSNVTDMSYMFYSCNELESIDLSSFDTSNVNDMNFMFSCCYDLASIDLSNFDTSNVTDMSYMFYSCNELESIDLSSFDTSNVTDMRSMFSCCYNLASIGLSNFDTSNVENMEFMFEECNKLTSLDLSNFTISIYNRLYSIFEGCDSLKELKLSSSFERIEKGYCLSNDPKWVNEKKPSIIVSGDDEKALFNNRGTNTYIRSDMVSPTTAITTLPLNVILPEYNSNVSLTYVEDDECEPVNIISEWHDDDGNYRGIVGTNAFRDAYIETTTITTIEVPEGGTVDLSDIKVNVIEQRRYNKSIYDISNVLRIEDYGYSDDGSLYIDIGTDYFLKNYYFEIDDSIKPLRFTIKIIPKENSTSVTETSSTTTTKNSNTVIITANTSQTEAIDYDKDQFFIVYGKFSPTMEDGGYVQLRWINKDVSAGSNGGVKVVWREAPSDLEYGDILVPEDDIAMTLLDSAMSIYPSSYYWDLADGTKLKKIGNCIDLMEHKVLTATHFDYLANQWYGTDFTDGEKTYRYSDNYFGSSVKVHACYSGADYKIKFAVYGDKLLIPIEAIDDDEETETTVTTTVTTTETTAATTDAPEKVTENFFAPISKWGEMAILDYESKSGIKSTDSVIKGNSDGSYSIILKDDKGNELVTYTIDPETGKGTADNDEVVDLPQTGNNSVKTAVFLCISVLSILTGAVAIYVSGMQRRKEK